MIFVSKLCTPPRAKALGERRVADDDVEAFFGIVLLDIAFLYMDLRIQIPGNRHRLGVNIETVGMVEIGKMVEELSHLELFLRVGIFGVAGKVRLFQVVRTANARLAVIHASSRNQIFARIDTEQHFLIDFCPFVLRDLLGNLSLLGISTL